MVNSRKGYDKILDLTACGCIIDALEPLLPDALSRLELISRELEFTMKHHGGLFNGEPILSSCRHDQGDGRIAGSRSAIAWSTSNVATLIAVIITFYFSTRTTFAHSISYDTPKCGVLSAPAQRSGTTQGQ